MSGEVKAVVADQWPLLRAGIALALRGDGIAVAAEVSRGGEAIDAARAVQAGLVVLGPHPDADVVTTATRAKRLDSGPAVIVLLEHIDREVVGALAVAGVDGFLLRSVGAPELVESARRVLDGQRVVAPAIVPLLVGAVRAAPSTAPVLTAKERDVLELLAAGQANRDIAAALYLAPATVKTHLANIYAKLSVRDRHEAVARAVAIGLLR